MKNSIIIKHIRISLLMQLILPVLLFTVSLILLYRTPFKGGLTPRAVDSTSKFSTAYDPDNLRVTVETENLRYTGYDSLKNGRIYGSYYYTLEDGRCRFYLLKPDSETAPAIVIGHANFNGILVPMDTDEYEEITSGIARSVGWTKEGVRSIAEPYMVSAQDFHHWKQLLLLAVLFLCIQIPLFDILLMLFYWLRPDFSPTIRRLNRYGDAKTHLVKAEMEMRHTCLVQTAGIYLTPNYLINMDRTKTAVIPLDSVAWIYYHGQLRRIFGMRRPLYYILRLMDVHGKNMAFARGLRDPFDEILSHMAELRPSVLTGYNDENQRTYREMTKKKL